MVDRTKREELARFLRTRRERLTPEEVGLPTGGRRRTTGLRREEVAVLAGLSPTWYTYLEQARSIRPSREVMDSLGSILRFTEDERLYVLALLESGAPELARESRESSSYVDLLADIVGQYDEGPFPVYAGDYRCDILAWNRAACEWYDDWDSMEPGERNMMRWLLTSPLARERLADWADVVGDFIARWRAELARHPTGHTEPLVQDYMGLCPEFLQFWEQHDVAEHRSITRRFRHEEFGEQAMYIVPMFPPELRSYTIVFHVPVAG